MTVEGAAAAAVIAAISDESTFGADAPVGGCAGGHGCDYGIDSVDCIVSKEVFCRAIMGTQRMERTATGARAMSLMKALGERCAAGCRIDHIACTEDYDPNDPGMAKGRTMKKCVIAWSAGTAPKINDVALAAALRGFENEDAVGSCAMSHCKAAVDAVDCTGTGDAAKCTATGTVEKVPVTASGTNAAELMTQLGPRCASGCRLDHIECSTFSPTHDGKNMQATCTITSK